MKHLSLAFTGFVQVFFVSVSTYMVSKEIYTGVYLSSFAISLLWTHNVKRIAFGNLTDKLVYSTGAAFGAASGVACSAAILKCINYFIN